jgi:hypothetical protein
MDMVVERFKCLELWQLNDIKSSWLAIDPPQGASDTAIIIILLIILCLNCIEGFFTTGKQNQSLAMQVD